MSADKAGVLGFNPANGNPAVLDLVAPSAGSLSVLTRQLSSTVNLTETLSPPIISDLSFTGVSLQRGYYLLVSRVFYSGQGTTALVTRITTDATYPTSTAAISQLGVYVDGASQYLGWGSSNGVYPILISSAGTYTLSFRASYRVPPSGAAFSNQVLQTRINN